MVTVRATQARSPPKERAVILLDGVARMFGQVRALDGLSLAVRRGEILGLLGHNGAGKTTSIRLIAGLLVPTQGRVRVDGLDPHADGERVRRRLGVLPANAAVDDRLTARENLQFAADLFDLPRAGLADRIAELLAAFDLHDRADERAGGFSTGMRQRLSLARVLLHDPDVLLLDEPTASLDPVAARNVRDLIAGLGARTDRTVVLCTHDLVEAQRLCDRVAILEHGRISALGTPAELAGAWGADVLVEVSSDDVAAALAIDVIADVRPTRDSDRVVRFPGVARGEVPRLVHALSGAGIRVYGVQRQEPSLEEVYLRLHAAKEEVPRCVTS
jgi:ABC-type multidrug transport system ATPase subunit